MNLKQRLSLLSGKDVWHTYGNKKLRIKSIMMADGPHGLRKQYDSKDNLGLQSSYPATLFPAAATVACSFNKDLAREMGKAIGEEALEADVQVVLGPGVNIKRNPKGGRNFEYYSEDPLLSGVMGASWIKGIQSQNVGASLKHFALNNQETCRLTYNAVVDHRTLREIYLKPFEIAVKAEPATVMAAYNKINGAYCTENYELLTGLLQKEWGYKGLVVSDWGAISNRVVSLVHGCDLEMPSSGGYNSKKILKAFKEEHIIDYDIDSSVRKVLNLVDRFKDNAVKPFDKDAHFRLAETIAADSIVLLKNEGILPLKAEEKIALVGTFAKSPRIQGGGSSNVNPLKVTNVLDEMNSYAKNYQFFRGYSMEKDGYDPKLVQEAVKAASGFDKIIIMAGLPDYLEQEGVDRPDIELPKGQLRLIEEISKVNPNVIVTVSAGAPVALRFEKQAKAILALHLLGGASGKPVLDILYGKISPSGRLAATYPLEITDDPSTSNFADGNNAVWYEESLFVGYRYYSTFKKPVAYPFGFGLSYTDFEYSELKVSVNEIRLDAPLEVRVKVRNIGKMAGSEVVQLYVKNNVSPVFKALRELRAFDKVFLQPNEQKEVVFRLDYEDFAYWDAAMKKFHVDKGTYKIQICKNCNEVILEKAIRKAENDPGFENPFPSAYNQKEYAITDEDFQKLLGRPLPPKNVIRHRPFTMDSTLDDIKRTPLGKIIRHKIIKEAARIAKEGKTPVNPSSIRSLIDDTPLRTLAVMSGGKISLFQAEGLVDLLNWRVIRGLNKL